MALTATPARTAAPTARLHVDHPLYGLSRHELVSKLADLAADTARFDILATYGDEETREAFTVATNGTGHLRDEAERLLMQTDTENRRYLAAHCARRSA